MDNVTIRPARMSDAGALTETFRTAYAPYLDLPGLPDVTSGLAESIGAHDILVATSNGHLLGGIVFSVDDGILHLMNLAVAPAAAGRGLGRQLVEAALSVGRNTGATCAVLGTHREMEATRRFYRSLGWRESANDGARVTYETEL